MTPAPRSNFSALTSPVVLAATLMMALIIGYLGANRYETYQLRQIERQAEFLAEKTAYIAAESLARNDINQLRYLTQSSQNKPDSLLAILIYRIDNHQLLAGQIPQRQRVNHETLIKRSHMIYDQQAPATEIGEVQVLMTTASLTEVYWQIFLIMGLTGWALLLLAATLAAGRHQRLENTAPLETTPPPQTEETVESPTAEVITAPSPIPATETVQKPLSAAQETINTEAKPSVDSNNVSHDGEKATLLVVDDDRANRMVLRRGLENKYNILEAPDGQRCLDMLTEHDVDLILLDLMMPIMSGFDVLRHIQEDSKNSYPNIIVLSALMDTTTISSVLSLGAKDYLTKPFNVEEMRARINTQVNLARRELALEDMVKQRTAELESTNKKLEETFQQLLQSEKMASIGQLAAGVAHEINNPIGFIYSNLSSLQDYIRDIEQLIRNYQKLLAAVKDQDTVAQTSLLEEINSQQEDIDLEFLLGDIPELMKDTREGTERVKNIVLNLKHFSRVDDDQMQLADINQGMESTLKIVWNELKYKCQVNKELGELPQTYCNINQLNQVFTNLLVNAAQAIESEGQIDVVTRTDNDEIVISVKDSGKGIEPENLNKLFEPFFTTKPVGQGTGLGLYLSYEIIQKHGGQIDVKSAIGHGTTFTIRLPIKTEA